MASFSERSINSENACAPLETATLKKKKKNLKSLYIGSHPDCFLVRVQSIHQCAICTSIANEGKKEMKLQQTGHFPISWFILEFLQVKQKCKRNETESRGNKEGQSKYGTPSLSLQEMGRGQMWDLLYVKHKFYSTIDGPMAPSHRITPINNAVCKL